MDSTMNYFEYCQRTNSLAEDEAKEEGEEKQISAATDENIEKKANLLVQQRTLTALTT